MAAKVAAKADRDIGSTARVDDIGTAAAAAAHGGERTV
jgi:hypothetical protein